MVDKQRAARRVLATCGAVGLATVVMATPAAARPLPEPPVKMVVYVEKPIVRTVEVPVDGLQIGQIVLAVLGGIAVGHATARRRQHPSQESVSPALREGWP